MLIINIIRIIIIISHTWENSIIITIMETEVQERLSTLPGSHSW